MKVFAGRHSASLDGDFVVFLIGTRLNRPWKLRRTLFVLGAMRPMVKQLEADPDSGLLRAEFGWMFGGPALVQYWRSFDHLDRFARDPGMLHLPAWKRFNQLVRGSGDVGIWHETYRVRAGEYEAIYGNMPQVGLGAAGEHRALGSTTTAAARIGARPDDQAPVAGY